MSAFFNGAPLILLHHRGRKSGREYVSPVMYLPSDTEPDVMYVFATKNGAPTNPAWYHNLMNARTADVEVGTETFLVSISEVTGPERDPAPRLAASRCAAPRVPRLFSGRKSMANLVLR